MQKDDCIFCKIAKGEIDHNKIYETEKSVAFLDISPASKKGGHTLVIPREHYELITDIPEDILADMANTMKKISKALLKFGEGLNILQNNKRVAGQFVNHAHFHLIPRFKNDGIEIEKWIPRKYQEGEMEEIREKIKKLL